MFGLVAMALWLACGVLQAYAAGTWNGWIYQNPYPTSNTLLAVKFVTAGKGWVAGEKGTILYTEDSGDTWVAQESGTEKNISGIAFVNEKQGWAVGNDGLIIHTVDGGETWKVQTSNTSRAFNQVYPLNDKEAWIVGSEGAVLHTSNGGNEWEKPDTGIERSIASIQFINAQLGWLLAGDEVYGTQDGGKKWNRLGKLPIDKLPRSGKVGDKVDGDLILNIMPEELGDDWGKGEIYFSDEKNGWAVVGIWFIFHTQDGGITWDNQLTTGYMSYGQGQISFRDKQKGCVIGTSILCTEDGKTWTERLGIKPAGSKSIEGFTVIPRGIDFFNESIGWVVGNGGQIMKTEDGGKTWNMVSRQNDCGGPFFVNSMSGWAYGDDDAICQTDNGGKSWVRQEPGINVQGLFFLDDLTGWVVGSMKEGKVEHFKPGGYSGKVWSVIQHTTDGGKSWKTQFKELTSKVITENALDGVFFLDRVIGWAVGEKGIILHTEDGGEHWSRQQSGDAKLHLSEVLFIDSNVGWITGTRVTDGWRGYILHTEDGGKHWQVQHKISDLWLGDMVFTDKKTGWVTAVDEGEGSYLLHTTDGGKTWEEESLGNVGYTELAFLDKAHGVLSSNKGWISVTNNGGQSWNQKRMPIRKYPWHFSELLKIKN